MQARYAETNTIGRQTAPPPPETPKARSTREAKPKSSTTAQSKSRQQEKPIDILAELPQAHSVYVAGSFNGWDQSKTPMRREGNGWKTTLSLAPGRYEYKFVVDGQWVCDPRAKECVQNDFGSSNSVLVV
jgi:1,4-alpha-glucan branching enzyme